MTTLTLDHVSRTYEQDGDVRALVDASIRIEQGDYIAIEGPSGSGKSTLLNQIALLDTPTRGRYVIDDIDTGSLNDNDRARLRSGTFSFVFQSFHLLDERTVLDNVALGTMYRGLDANKRRTLGMEALEFVGLAHKAEQTTAKLSGGERQRVAIARAIASRAPVLVADEPTGNLDQANGAQVMDALESLNARGVTVILVTHDQGIAQRAHRRMHVLDGVLSETSTKRAGEVVSTDVLVHVGAMQMDGSPSTVRLRDGIADAWKGLWSTPPRTLALIGAIALAVGLAVTSTGLAQTARFQVSDIFDAQRNQRVAMTLSPETGTPAGDQSVSLDSLDRLSEVAGVDDALVLATHDQHAITTAPGTPPIDEGGGHVDLVGVVGGGLPDSILSIDSAGMPLDSLHTGEAIIGENLAQMIELGPLLASPVVWVDGRPQRVVGILNDAGLQLGLLNSILLHEDDAAGYSALRYATAELKVAPGAAAQVAEQAPIAWVPASPEQVRVDAPPDPTTLRDSIESKFQTMLLTLTGVAMLAAVLSLTNAMTTAVFQRIGEFGLRRAIGARRRHITGLVLAESLAIGALGGIAGAYAAILVILGVTLYRQWQPVLDPLMILVGVVGGTFVGLIGGLVATRKASRIEPSDALRA